MMWLLLAKDGQYVHQKKGGCNLLKYTEYIIKKQNPKSL